MCSAYINFSLRMITWHVFLYSIVVINVRNKFKKTLKNALFILKIKKTFVNVIKNVTLFFYLLLMYSRAC